jgi:hypothetical protein
MWLVFEQLNCQELYTRYKLPPFSAMQRRDCHTKIPNLQILQAKKHKLGSDAARVSHNYSLSYLILCLTFSL